MLKVIDKYGVERDVLTDAKVQYPVAQIMELVEEKTSHTIAGELKAIMQASKLLPDGVVEITNDDGDRILTRVRDGKGVFGFDSKGEEYKKPDPSTEKRSTTTCFGEHQIKIYIGFLCTLMPHLGKIYLKTKGLDINHCIIPSEGHKYPARCTEFFEMVGKTYNCNHSWFVKKWSLYDTPVSAYDIERLKMIYEANGVADNEHEPLVYQVFNITDAFKNKDATIIKRQLITWWYFMKQHTNMNEYVWDAFKDYLRSITPDYVNMATNERITECMEQYIKF